MLLACDCSSGPEMSGDCRGELIAELFCLELQAVNTLLSIPFLICLGSFVNIGLSPTKQSINQSADLSGARKDGYVCPVPLGRTPVVCPQRRVAMAKCLRRHA